MKVKVGLFGIGLETYWGQFTGLQERLTGYLDDVARNMEMFDAEICNTGLVDKSEKASEAGVTFKREAVDIIFLYASTYALSATVLPVGKKTNVPVTVLNLSLQGKTTVPLELAQWKVHSGLKEDERKTWTIHNPYHVNSKYRNLV